jgi:hypothetical protein
MIWDPYTDIIEAMKSRLEGDDRFGGRNVKILYDRTQDRQVPVEMMPAINFFLEAPWHDIALGTGSMNLTGARHLILRFGFGIWVAGMDAADLDRNLFALGFDLFDFFYVNRLWNEPKGICIGSDIRMDFDYGNAVDGTLIGTQKLSVDFDMWSS